jgi:Secretion system C-terminal sorting domain
MKKYTVLLFILTSGILFSQTYSGPESAEYDYANSRWLIANTTSHQVLARNTAGVLSVFATGLVSGPYGIEIVGDVLYCCSGTSIKGYSLATGLSVFNVNIGATFLNGLTHDNSGNLYATDFSAKKIFKINIASQAFAAVASSLVQSPNGIIYDAANNRCVFVNWGSNAPIKAIDLTSFAVTTILPTTLSSCDGIARDGSGNYYISTWGSQNVVKYDSAFANAPVSISTGLSSPADLFYNVVDNVLAIPNSGNNTVTFVNFALSISEYENSWLKTVTVTPNPIVEQAVFNFELNTAMKVSADLVDIQGRVINTLLFPNNFTQQGHIEIPTDHLNKGVYFLNFKANNYSKSIPILFQGK